MLKRITIQDFQAHRNLSLDLNNPVTTIIGPSDTGKSAILRALRWALLNQSPGGDFVNHDAKNASVSVEVDDRVVERGTNGTTNRYQMGDETYTAFGRVVPEDIADFLQISEINFQGQHEAPFWFADSAAEVSRQLNQIVNLELIDRTQSKLDSMLRTARTVLTEREERVKEAREERRRLQFVFKMNRDLTTVKEKAAASDEKERAATDLVNLIADLEDKKERTKRLSSANCKLTKVLKLGQTYADKETQRDALEQILGSTERLLAIASLPAPDVTTLSRTAEKATNIAARKLRLGVAIDKAEEVRQSMENDSISLELMDKQIKELTKGKCPLCGNLLPKSSQ